MAVYRFSWVLYLTFVFLTAFIFLNMMVGTVLEIMGRDYERYRAQLRGESAEGGEPASRAQINKLEHELAEIKTLLLGSVDLSWLNFVREKSVLIAASRL